MLNLISGADIARMAKEPKSAKQASEWAESSYRRGYCDGMQMAINYILKLSDGGFNRTREQYQIIEEFIYTELQPWRMNYKQGYIAPSLKQKSWWDIRQDVFARDGRVCSLCGSTKDLEIDHILEVKNGGLPVLENLRVLCRRCNRRRNSSEQ